MSKDYQGLIDTTFGNATGSSSSAPTYFDPKIYSDNYNRKQAHIDGGLICNNPSFYAYQLARLVGNHEKIRVVSLGTGEKPF